MLDELVRLTHDASAAGRQRLLHAVTDLYLAESKPSEVLRDHYSEIATRSVDSLTVADRTAYARRVATSPTLPRIVATRLAADQDIAVAETVLKLSPVLDDADLEAIVADHSQLHLVAVAERAALSETLTDALVEKGAAMVRSRVSANPGARLSSRGLARLMESAESEPEIARGLIRQAARLPPAAARRVLEIAAQARPNRTAGGAAAQGAATPTGAGAHPGAAKRLIQEVRHGKSTLDDVLLALAGKARVVDASEVISAFSSLPVSQSLQVLLHPDGSGIARICRALGLTAQAFEGILSLRAGRLKLSRGQLRRDALLYSDLPPEALEHALAAVREKFKLG